MTVSENTMRKSDRWIPWMIVAFFVVVAILDGIFVYLASSTHTGVVTDHAYNRGLEYNETIAAAKQQDALGWHGEIDFQAGEGVIEFSLLGEDGAAVKGASVTAEFVRPVQDGMDFSVTLNEQADGTYASPVTFPVAGQWDARVFVEWKQKQFQHSKRLVVAK